MAEQHERCEGCGHDFPKRLLARKHDVHIWVSRRHPNGSTSRHADVASFWCADCVADAAPGVGAQVQRHMRGL